MVTQNIKGSNNQDGCWLVAFLPARPQQMNEGPKRDQWVKCSFKMIYDLGEHCNNHSKEAKFT